MSCYFLEIVERAVGATIEEEVFEGTQLGAEQRLGDMWNAGPAGAPGRFKATARPAGGQVVHTIE